MAEYHLLIVDDEKNILTTLSRALSVEGYPVTTCETAEKALEILQFTPIDLVLIDVKLPGMDGIELLTKIKEYWPEMLAVMMSGHGTIETAVEATQKGAYSFIEKPLSAEKVLITISNALKYSTLQQENVALRQEVEERYQMVGDSRIMKELLHKIILTAPTSGRVLIIGENGTGKELVARAIHRQSKRTQKPFIKVNCAAIPKELIESELFGHEKGAFTGAVRMRQGKFELADGGTLFLDEIGDMMLEMQAKLLRVLQEGEFERVGGTEMLSVDVRIIAASNKVLAEEIKNKNFREDLYYRLNVIPFFVPPLRDRLEDIVILTDHFISQACFEHGKREKTIDSHALKLLRSYDWPGNVRELKNIVERTVILVPSENITAHDIQKVLPVSDSAPNLRYEEGRSLKEMVQQAEREFIIQSLEQNRWHMKKTAQKLKIERSHLYKKMKQLNIQLAGNED